MTPRYQVSRAALELIERFEGYRRKAARLADGRWTIGYGHTLTAREGAEVSLADAEALLLYDVRPVAAAVNEWTYTPLSQNQFDALVAFAFNVGIDNFRRSSVLRRINEGALIQAAGALEMWRKADFEGERIVVDALVRRRAAEKALFLTPAGGWIPAPSPVLQPRVDYDVGQTIPETTTDLETPLTGDKAEARRVEPSQPTAADEENIASRAAADAVSAKLSEILPETPAEPAPAMPDPAPVHAVMSVPTESLFSADTDVIPVIEPVVSTPRPESAAQTFAEPAQKPQGDRRLDIPARAEGVSQLSRRVVWREAPMETDAVRLLGTDSYGRLSPLVLVFLFLAGLAVFAGGIVWGLNTKGSGLISWALGLMGIVCVVSSVYVYLERLGGDGD